LLFLGHNLQITNASGSRDADFRLFFLKNHKIAAWGWGPGSNDVNQKNLNLPLMWRHPQKHSNPKLTNFFKS